MWVEPVGCSRLSRRRMRCSSIRCEELRTTISLPGAGLRNRWLPTESHEHEDPGEVGQAQAEREVLTLTAASASRASASNRLLSRERISTPGIPLRVLGYALFR
jgi:hypothetical protein